MPPAACPPSPVARSVPRGERGRGGGRWMLCLLCLLCQLRPPGQGRNAHASPRCAAQPAHLSPRLCVDVVHHKTTAACIHLHTHKDKMTLNNSIGTLPTYARPRGSPIAIALPLPAACPSAAAPAVRAPTIILTSPCPAPIGVPVRPSLLYPLVPVVVRWSRSPLTALTPS